MEDLATFRLIVDSVELMIYPHYACGEFDYYRWAIIHKNSAVTMESPSHAKLENLVDCVQSVINYLDIAVRTTRIKEYEILIDSIKLIAESSKKQLVLDKFIGIF